MIQQWKYTKKQTELKQRQRGTVDTVAKVLTVEETVKSATGTEQKSGQSELLQVRKNIREKVVRV